MGLTVEQASGRVDRWDAIAGETRWVDYAHEESGGDLVVYVHTFRRVRERHDLTRDVVLWKPATTSVAHRYAAGEWTAVAHVERAWPPREAELVPRRRRRRAS